MPPFTTRSEQFESRVQVVGTRPEDTIRSIVSRAISPKTLPSTQDFQLHYICGIDSNSNQVVFTPEFLYLLQAGLPGIAGIRVEYRVDGLGDSTFPEFATHRLFTVQGYSATGVVFPASAGRILIKCVQGTSSDSLSSALRPYSTAVHHIAGDLYFAEVTPFYEPALLPEISALALVQHAELDFVSRIVDGITWIDHRIV